MFDVGRDHVACPFVAHGAGEDVEGELGELGPDILKNIGVETFAELEFLELLRTDRAIGNPDVGELRVGIACIHKPGGYHVSHEIAIGGDVDALEL